MPRRRLPEPIRLFRRIQSKRLSLGKRLCALAELSQLLDQLLCQHDGRGVMSTDPRFLDAFSLLEATNEVVRMQLLPLLDKRRIHFAPIVELNSAQQAWLATYFQQNIYPLLTPLAVDPAHPFPRIVPKQMHLLVTLHSLDHPLRKGSGYLAARAQSPDATAFPSSTTNTTTYHGLDTSPLEWTSPPPYPKAPATSNYTFAQKSRLQLLENLYADREIYGLLNVDAVRSPFISIPKNLAKGSSVKQLLVWREAVIQHFITSVFPGMSVTGTYQFRILCNMQKNSGERIERETNDVSSRGSTQESIGIDGQETISRLLSLRNSAMGVSTSSKKQMPVSHIDLEVGTPSHLSQWLAEHLHVSSERIAQLPPPLNLASLQQLVSRMV